MFAKYTIDFKHFFMIFFMRMRMNCEKNKCYKFYVIHFGIVNKFYEL